MKWFVNCIWGFYSSGQKKRWADQQANKMDSWTTLILIPPKVTLACLKILLLYTLYYTSNLMAKLEILPIWKAKKSGVKFQVRVKFKLKKNFQKYQNMLPWITWSPMPIFEQNRVKLNIKPPAPMGVFVYNKSISFLKLLIYVDFLGIICQIWVIFVHWGGFYCLSELPSLRISLCCQVC